MTIQSVIRSHLAQELGRDPTDTECFDFACAMVEEMRVAMLQLGVGDCPGFRRAGSVLTRKADR